MYGIWYCACAIVLRIAERLLCYCCLSKMIYSSTAWQNDLGFVPDRVGNQEWNFFEIHFCVLEERMLEKHSFQQCCCIFCTVWRTWLGERRRWQRPPLGLWARSSVSSWSRSPWPSRSRTCSSGWPERLQLSVGGRKEQKGQSSWGVFPATRSLLLWTIWPLFFSVRSHYGSPVGCRGYC